MSIVLQTHPTHQSVYELSVNDGQMPAVELANGGGADAYLRAMMEAAEADEAIDWAGLDDVFDAYWQDCRELDDIGRSESTQPYLW